jgi:hypothetical protein
VATSVNAGPLASVDQLSSSPLDWLNRSSENRHQAYGMPATEVYSASVVSDLVPTDLDRSPTQMSQGDIVSQNRSHIWTIENEPATIPPRPIFPGQNEHWPETAQSRRAYDKDPECLVDFQSCALLGAEFQQMPGFSEAGMAYQGFMQAPRCPNCGGCCACNTVILETTPVGPQPGMHSSLGMSSGFNSLSSSGIREQTVPDHLFHNNLLFNQVIPQNSGSLLENFKFCFGQAKIFVMG